MAGKFVLIDTFNFLHRAYHALPKSFADKDGEPTNAVYGVASMLINVFDQLSPDYAVAALDDIKPTFRVEDFTGYKAHRKPMEDDLSSQIPKVFEIIDAFGLKKISLPGYEADDVIGTLANMFSGSGIDLIIVSNDRDMWQLIKPGVLVMSPGAKGSADWIGEREVVAREGFFPNQIPDYKGLRGDPSDNIPGVYGVGDKTAKTLISDYSTIENLFSHLDEVKPDSLRKRLTEGYEQALMSKNLATIVTDAPLSMEKKEFIFDNDLDKLELKKVLEKYNFKSLLKRIDGGNSIQKSTVKDSGQLPLF